MERSGAVQDPVRSDGRAAFADADHDHHDRLRGGERRRHVPRDDDWRTGADQVISDAVDLPAAVERHRAVGSERATPAGARRIFGAFMLPALRPAGSRPIGA